jgi:tRNA (uracil-5-)-methyltransferase TRM9
MRNEVQAQLLALNRQFYATVGAEFDRTRQGLPAGMVQLAALLRRPDPALRVLDAGCGNGRFARALAQVGVQGSYLGVDADPALLRLAREQTSTLPDLVADYRAADLAAPDWPDALHDAAPFDAVISLAVLHHFPGIALRRRLVADLAGLLTPDGVLALSTWQFLTSERLSDKLVPWAEIGLDAADVEHGDALLPWNQGAYALRYVHHLDLPEVEALAADVGLRVTESFREDGKEGNLNLYVCMSKALG